MLGVFISGSSGTSWSNRNDGQQRRDGECSECSFLLIKTVILEQTATTVLLQGARGLDGDPGPQGVAGATVRLTLMIHAFISIYSPAMH